MGLGSIAGAIGGALANPMVAGAAMSMAGGVYQNYENKKAAQRQMDFQSHMSDTAYQRAMADMKKAGLNPILAGKLGGASTPGGAMPVLHDPVTPAINTGLQVSNTNADVALKTANTALTNVKTILSQNLVPGSEAVSTIAQGVADLVKAADEYLRNDGPGVAAGVIDDLKIGYNKLVEKAKAAGVNVNEMFNEVNQYLDDQLKDTLQYFKE